MLGLHDDIERSRLRDFCNEFDNFVSTAGRLAWNFVVDVQWQILPTPDLS